MSQADFEIAEVELEAVWKLKKSLNANLSTFDALSHKGEMWFFALSKFNTRAKIAPQTRFYSTKVTRKRRKKGNVIFANPTQEERDSLATMMESGSVFDIEYDSSTKLPKLSKGL